MTKENSSETPAPKPQAPPPNTLTGVTEYGEGNTSNTTIDIIIKK